MRTCLILAVYDCSSSFIKNKVLFGYAMRKAKANLGYSFKFMQPVKLGTFLFHHLHSILKTLHEQFVYKTTFVTYQASVHRKSCIVSTWHST